MRNKTKKRKKQLEMMEEGRIYLKNYNHQAFYNKHFCSLDPEEWLSQKHMFWTDDETTLILRGFSPDFSDELERFVFPRFTKNDPYKKEIIKMIMANSPNYKHNRNFVWKKDKFEYRKISQKSEKGICNVRGHYLVKWASFIPSVLNNPFFKDRLSKEMKETFRKLSGVKNWRDRKQSSLSKDERELDGQVNLHFNKLVSNQHKPTANEIARRLYKLESYSFLYLASNSRKRIRLDTLRKKVSKSMKRQKFC